MSNYYQGGGGVGGGGSYGRGRGYSGSGPSMGYPQGGIGIDNRMSQGPAMASRDQEMGGMRGRGYDGGVGGVYDYGGRGPGDSIQRGSVPSSHSAPSRPPQEITKGRTPVSIPQGPGVKYANDCEIIVTSKAQQQYAEMIEKAIKDFKLKVDIMFPKPDVKLAAFIENIASMGAIFAVVIRPDNEAHRSVSVHVLRGCPKPEEHRNMPLTVAYQLIRDRYTDIKRKEIGVVPENMKVILKHLLEEQPLNDSQYTIIIKFLQNRRIRQKAFENRTSNVVENGGMDDLLNNPDAEELKQRILTVLNGTVGKPDGERTGGLIVPKPKEPLAEIFKDPLASLNPPNYSHQGSSNASRGIGRGYGRGH